MNYLLDTNIISEIRKSDASPKVVEWISQMQEDRLYLSIVTLGEIQKGITKLPQSKKKTKLQVWLNDVLPRRFTGRILSIGVDTMLEWGNLLGEAENKGMPLPVVDALIAAIAIEHNLVVVTRNTDDYKMMPVKLLNPYT